MKKAKLFVRGKERELLWTDLTYYKYLNPKTGRCGEIPMGGLVSFTFASGFDDESLLHWMTYSAEGEFCTLEKGEIVFYEGDFDGVILYKYRFDDATPVYWGEEFDANGTEPMTITMTISAAIQQFKWQTLIKHWQESWVPPSDKMPYMVYQEKGEPKLIDYHFENKKGEPLNQKDIKHNQDITLVIATKNSENTTLTLGLNNEKLNFIHQGKVVEDDILKGIKISGKTTRVPLTAVKQ